MLEALRTQGEPVDAVDPGEADVAAARAGRVGGDLLERVRIVLSVPWPRRDRSSMSIIGRAMFMIPRALGNLSWPV